MASDFGHCEVALAGCTVTIHEHLDGAVSIRYGPHVVGRFDGQGQTVERAAKQQRRGKVEISHKTRDFHFPTAPTMVPLSKSKPKPKARAA